jgi:hypothetical protein
MSIRTSNCSTSAELVSRNLMLVILKVNAEPRLTNRTPKNPFMSISKETYQ